MDVTIQYYPVFRKPVTPAYVVRLREEKAELDRRFKALDECLGDQSCLLNVSSVLFGIMCHQHDAMKLYQEALTARLEYLETSEK